jgi:hypothetical protein
MKVIQIILALLLFTLRTCEILVSCRLMSSYMLTKLYLLGLPYALKKEAITFSETFVSFYLVTKSHPIIRYSSIIYAIFDFLTFRFLSMVSYHTLQTHHK